MNILFIHQNFPGQYKHLAPALAAQPGNRVIGVGDVENLKRLPPSWGGLEYVVPYPRPQKASASTHHYVQGFESGVRRGQNVARVLIELKKNQFEPDVVCVHPGWGEALYVRDIYPDARIVMFAEFYYRSKGSDVGFDPSFPIDIDDICKVRTRNAHQLLSIEAADVLISPTKWQKAQYPALFSSRIQVIHDGIDTDIVIPREDAVLAVSDSLALTARDEVITYVARNLEPYRGFLTLMRALPKILRLRPQAHVVILGGDDVSYGRPPDKGKTYRQLLTDELGSALDTGRVHFLGYVPYARYLDVLAVSTVHVYLTYPFVLSWSLLEAMACGCTVVASDTAPVREVVRHGENGRLTDFFDSEALADHVVELCADRNAMAPIRRKARQAIVKNYDLRRICLPRQIELVRRLGTKSRR